MINFDGNHGTDNAHVRSILTTGFNLSVNDSHWLGDGIYFFVKGKSNHPEIQAEQWAILQAWDKVSQSNKYDHFSVLKTEISVEESNFLDLTEPKGLEIFEYIKRKSTEKIRRIRSMRSVRILDGYLINLGRKEMGLQFDVVKGDVFIKLTKEDRYFQFQSRFPNSTICAVYNPNCISNISNIKTGRI